MEGLIKIYLKETDGSLWTGFDWLGTRSSCCGIVINLLIQLYVRNVLTEGVSASALELCSKECVLC
jgi:hypothetical protein